MKNVSHKKGWNSGTTQEYVEPMAITLIKGTYNGKSDKEFVKLKLCRDTTYIMSDLYEDRMSLFDNGNLECFCCLCVTST